MIPDADPRKMKHTTARTKVAPVAIQVLHIETGHVYPSIADAARALRIGANTMRTWLDNPEKPFVPFRYKSVTKVLDLVRGEKFESVRIAARHHGVHPGTMYKYTRDPASGFVAYHNVG